MAVVIADHPERERYEIEVDGELAGFAEYRGRGELRAFTHTEIDPAFEGRGLASQLIAWALDDVRAHGLHVLPVCPFVKAFLADPRHASYLDLVAPKHRAAFGLPAAEVPS